MFPALDQREEMNDAHTPATAATAMLAKLHGMLPATDLKHGGKSTEFSLLPVMKYISCTCGQRSTP